MNDRDNGKEAGRTARRPVWHGPAGGFLDRFLHAGAPSGTEGRNRPAASGEPAAARGDDGEGRREREGGAPASPPAGEDAPAAPLRERVIEALRRIYDPEIPVNLYDLGLIYAVEVTQEGDVSITMTLTTPHCPVAESMPYEVEARVLGVEGVRDVEVHLVWDPPWDMSMMSDEARLELGLI